MANTNTWTLMNTSITRTTKYGYSNTCTLADAMHNRQYNMCSNLAANFGSLGMAIAMVAARKPKAKSFRTDDITDLSKYEVALIAGDNAARDFVERHHYSRSYPAARLRVGLYRGSELAGVAVFSHPPSEKVLARLPCDRLAGVELGRFILLDDVLFAPGRAPVARWAKMSIKPCEACNTFAFDVVTPVGEGAADLCWICAHYVTHHDMPPTGPIPEHACGCTREEIYPAHVLEARAAWQKPVPVAPERPFLLRSPARARGYAISEGIRRARIARVSLHRAREDANKG